MKTLSAIIVFLLLATPVCAQTPDNSPFKVSAVLDRTSVLPGGTIRLGIVLDVPPKHHVFADKLKVTIPPTPGIAVVSIDIPPGRRGVAAGEEALLLEGQAVSVVTLAAAKDASGTFVVKPTVALQGCSDKICFAPETRTLPVEIPVATPANPPRPVNGQYFKAAASSVDAFKQVRARYDFRVFVEKHGYAPALLVAFLWGFLVSFTPCVWPLIPVILAVVGTRTTGSGWKRGLGLSLLYVFGMSLTYAALGLIAALAGAGAQSAAANPQALATNPWVVGLVCLVFVALALSMFGLYEIQLPASWSGKLQSRRGRGLLGVWVMGLISGLVAGPCVSAPLLGLLAGVAEVGSAVVGLLAGLLFGWGMGAVLIIAGTSAKTLQAFPRAGEWTVAVKKFFGWVMLGVAIYLAQPVIGLAAYELAMGVFLVVAAMFMGALDRPTVETKWTARLKQGLGIIVLLLGIVWFLSGVAPMAGFAPSTSPSGPAAGGIRWVSSVDEGLADAKDRGEPAIIDFRADWCVYCKEMDREVFADPEVIRESARFVMIRADATSRTPEVDALERRFAAPGPPTLVFVWPDGRHNTVPGKIDRDTMLGLMRAVR